MENNTICLKDFPECPVRKGRVDPVTKEAYMSCGFTEIEPKKCMCCGGIKKGTTLKIKKL